MDSQDCVSADRKDFFRLFVFRYHWKKIFKSFLQVEHQTSDLKHRIKIITVEISASVWRVWCAVCLRFLEYGLHILITLHILYDFLDWTVLNAKK